MSNIDFSDSCLPDKNSSTPYKNEIMLNTTKEHQNQPQSFVNTTQKDALENLVDLEEVVLNWAKLIFNTTKSKAEAKIKKKYLSGFCKQFHSDFHVCFITRIDIVSGYVVTTFTRQFLSDFLLPL
ncbi:hypothetical protein DICVIV_04511 [Dictyocaulus viviparus]|uniref:Uncharacterized protein n=1 Tax=Dictyocaulus viviparus TaxID=29172 RepID=A0A0D8Y479_DICVI|nr:hypothetical protein DICVIV_04511 [Dictyocaulus viviparus]